METPKALLAIPLNSQSSKEETSGQGSAKNEANQYVWTGQQGPPPPAGWAEIQASQNCGVSLSLTLWEERGAIRDAADFSLLCKLNF